MTTFICNIHNIEFQQHHCSKTNRATRCPLCAEEESGKLKSRLAAAEEHRDLLLAVIELKQTFTPLT